MCSLRFPFLNSCKLNLHLWHHKIISICFWRSVYLPETASFGSVSCVWRVIQWIETVWCAVEEGVQSAEKIYIRRPFISIYISGFPTSHQKSDETKPEVYMDSKWYCIHISFITNLIAFEVGPSAGSKTLLTAETLQLWTHTQRVAFYPFLLAPNTHYLHILDVIHWRGGGGSRKKV